MATFDAFYTSEKNQQEAFLIDSESATRTRIGRFCEVRTSFVFSHSNCVAHYVMWPTQLTRLGV
jgi:hypothetical protein